MENVKLVQTKEGREVTYRGHIRGQKITVKVDREWDVFLDDEKIGSIRYHMLTRERKTPGRMYVNSRWESPGWTWHPLGGGGWRGFELDSRKWCVEALVNFHKR